MDTEKREQLKVYLKVFLICVCAGLYAWGGIEMKWLRRFLAPSICGISCFIFSRNWWSLLYAPFLGISSSIGYGSDIFWVKIIKRAYVGLAFGIASGFMGILKKNWTIIIFTVVTCTLGFILFGVFNQTGSPRIEENWLGLLIYTPPIITAKRSE